jgi:hypothetical protein
VNPRHLRLVSQWRNNYDSNSITARSAKRTHCELGHKLEKNNLYKRPSCAKSERGSCVECRKIKTREYYSKNKDKIHANWRRYYKRKKLKEVKT